MAQDYPMSGPKSVGQFVRDKKEKHLIYCVDKGLSIVATETHNQLSFVVDREDIHNQRGAFIGTKGIVDQAF